MAPHPVRPPGVWRTCATYLLNVLGAAAGPIAAGIWFSDAFGLRRIVPENATAWRGFGAACGVALAWTSFGVLDGADVGGAIKRGLALGAASVGGAAGATISTIFALFAGAIGCCCGGRFDPESLEAPGDDASHFTTPEAALYVLISVGAPLLGFVLSCRLWWLATRASKTSVHDRPLALELVVALAVAAAIVAAAGGLRHAGSPFALIVLLFVVVGHARGARPAAAPSAGASSS